MDIPNTYQKIQEKILPTKPLSDNAENRYWHSFKQILDKQYDQAVKAVYAQNNTKNKIAISYGKGMEIFSTNKNQITQSFKRFHHPALSIALRSDSQLLASGHEDGFIQIIHLKTKAQLRTFRNFKKPVQTMKFGSGLEYLFAASDEGIVKQFSIPTDQVVRSIAAAHSDFIRSICTLEDGSLLTSSYDKTIKLFDLRTTEVVKTFHCEHPVESILVMPNNINFVSAQDQYTTLWDLRKDKIQELHTNQKTVTSLTLASYHDTHRVISGSIDHQMKYIRTDIFSVTHQQKWSSPILCLDASDDGQNIAIGGSDGRLEILQIKQSKEEDEEMNEQDYLPEYLKSNPHLQRKIKNYTYYNRGIYQKTANYDFKIQSQGQLKFTGYDKLLVQFKYKEAMLKAYSEKQTAMIISLYEELADRGALKTAFRNLDISELESIVEFTLLKLSNPKFQTIMMAILDLLLDLYQEEIVNEAMIRKIQEELEIENQMQIMQGMLNTLISN